MKLWEVGGDHFSNLEEKKIYEGGTLVNVCMSLKWWGWSIQSANQRSGGLATSHTTHFSSSTTIHYIVTTVVVIITISFSPIERRVEDESNLSKSQL